MSVPLFERRWSLTVSQPKRPNALAYSSDVDQGEPLRLNFGIERTLHSESNKAKISLLNLQRAHRSLIAPGSTVIMRAGYGSSYDIIYRGTVAQIETSSSGTDVTTDLIAGDGEPYLQQANVNLSYRSTVSLARVIQDICAYLNVTVAGQVFVYKGHVVQRIPRVTMGRRVFHGTVKQVLDDLLHPQQMSWSIQCGTLLIQNAEGIINLNAQSLSPDTGLLGIPSKTKSGVKFKSLLLPGIAPGLAVQVKCSDPLVSGNFRCVSAKYQGDTHGDDWNVEAECQTLTYPLATYVKETSQLDFEAAQQQGADPEDVDMESQE